MTALIAAWFSMHFFLNPPIKNPDGHAKMTGSCGDTMELELKFKGAMVADYYLWTDGCSISKMCLATTASLARGKTVEELVAIDKAAILEKTGQLPDTHIHCAQLAEITLQLAVEDYVRKGLSQTDEAEARSKASMVPSHKDPIPN
jgi:NifU-like protein involved in Fe-S cluster formation